MQKFISNLILALPGIVAAIDKWGGRLMDFIGVPGAAQQLEAWRLEYFPKIGAGTYWLIGFSVIAVALLNFIWRKDESSKTSLPASSKENATDIDNDVKPEFDSSEIVQLRSDVKRLVRTLGDYGSPSDQRQTVLERMGRIEASDHAVWLDDRLEQARVDFLHWCGCAQRVREKDGPTFRTRQERDETLSLLKDAATRIEAGLTGQPVPLPAVPDPDDTPTEDEVLKGAKPEYKIKDLVLAVLKIEAFDIPDPDGEIGRLLSKIRQEALYGTIEIWGRKDSDDGWDDLDIIPRTEIPKKYWNNYKINEYEFKINNGHSITVQDGDIYDSIYSDLAVSRDQARKVWPEVNTSPSKKPAKRTS